MGKNNPIKRSEALKALSKDHHFNLLFIWKIRQGLKLKVELLRIKNFIAHFLNEQILQHFSKEENYLFCLLPGDEPLRLHAESEHSAIKKIGAAISEQNISENKIEEFTNLLESHIRFEERTFFPYIEKNISYEKLAKAAIHFAAEHSDDWSDAFWLTKK
jgi:iron-sulfur cluster repair protein YtfE (RIC family)